MKVEGFPSVFFSESTSEIYSQQIEEAIHKFRGGCNTAVFAYGQTGSGKTHTVFGREQDGLVYLALRDLLPDNISIAYFQIHNERIYDMSTTKELMLYVHGHDIHIAGLHVEDTRTETEAFEFLNKCEANRRVSATERNSHSSRSHVIIQIRRGKAFFYFIDLAGSEKARGTEQQKQEGAYINRSLLALGRVVRNVASGRCMGFRESKLTRILQPVMNASTHLVAFCTFSTRSSCLDESLATLSFASRLCSLDLRMVDVTEPVQEGSVSRKLSLVYEDLYKSKLKEQMVERENATLKISLSLCKERISSLEKMVADLLAKSPSRLISEIFVLERQMFNLKTDPSTKLEDENTNIEFK